MVDVLQKSFELPVTINGKVYEFTFKIPGIKFDIEVGYKAAEIRTRAYPPANGQMAGLDQSAFQWSRCAAYMELYLEKSPLAWVFSEGADKKPVVNYENFPGNEIDTVYLIGAAFEEAYGRFRRGGDINPRPSGADVVGSQPDSGAS
jgi:hypothetical protein